MAVRGPSTTSLDSNLPHPTDPQTLTTLMDPPLTDTAAEAGGAIFLCPCRTIEDLEGAIVVVPVAPTLVTSTPDNSGRNPWTINNNWSVSTGDVSSSSSGSVSGSPNRLGITIVAKVTCGQDTCANCAHTSCRVDDGPYAGTKVDTPRIYRSATEYELPCGANQCNGKGTGCPPTGCPPPP